MNMPKVSVIIPTYNRAKNLIQSIDSVMNQTYQDLEIIIVDDGSTDNTKEVLSKYDGKVRYFYQENRGVSAARNIGIKESRGEFIAFLDSDDSWLGNKLEQQMKLFQYDPSVSLQYSYARYLDKANNIEFIRPKNVSKSFKDFLYEDTVLPTSSVVLKKSVLEEVGMFDEGLPGIEDYDLWLRCSRKFKIGFIPETLVLKNNSSSNLSFNHSKMYIGYIKVCEKLLANLKTEIDSIFIKRRLAKNYYLLAKEQYLSNLSREALKNLLSALKTYPAVGVLFFVPKENQIKKSLKIIKPYLFLFTLLFKSI